MKIAHVIAGFTLLCAAGCNQDAQSPAKIEVSEKTASISLPPTPEFIEPQPNADGTHSVLEMRRKGKQFIDQDVQVSGYVVWRYDCESVIGKKAMTDTPERCERPHFYLGTEADTPTQKSIMIVDVPRPPRPDEIRVLPKEDLKNWPEVPVYEVGTQVTVTGKWATRSPLGFIRTDGLLIYASLTHPEDAVEEPPAK